MEDNQGKLKFENLVIENHPDEKQAPENFRTAIKSFGSLFSPYMFVCDYSDGKWGEPKIMPYQNFTISPACPCFHYGSGCFEGMKAYRNGDNVYLFRPHMNMKRMNASCKRICLPGFPEKEVLKIIAKLAHLQKEWIPDIPDFSLYVRPFCIGTAETLGVRPPNKARLSVITCSVAGYYAGDCHLLVDRRYLRAYPGGTGQWKLGGNYAPTIMPQQNAMRRGFNQLLWCSTEGKVQEVGTMNFFVHWTNEKGEDEVVTAPLEEGTILPGVTRYSVIEILKAWKVNIQEKTYYLEEMIKAFKEKRIKECFGSGTAAVICPVHSITLSTPEGENGERFECPLPKEGVGARIKAEIIKIQRGVSKDFGHMAVNVLDIMKED